MTLLELIIPAGVAIVTGFIAGFFGRRLERSKAIQLDSDVLLKWTEEFKDKATKNEASLVKAEERIDALEAKVKETVLCNEDLERELNIVKSDRDKLQSRITVLEEENAVVKQDREKLQNRVTVLETENAQLKLELEKLQKTRRGKKEQND